MSTTRAPVVVFDSNIDALTRRAGTVQAAVPSADVLATPSRTGVLVLGAVAEAGTTMLLDLCVTDGFSLDRPGERLIQRLVRSPTTSHVRPVAWSAHVGPEVVVGVREAGGAGFVTATLRREREANELRAVLAGETVWPREALGNDHWDAWFLKTYGEVWRPWMEPILVRLAAGMERRSVGAELVAAGAANSVNHAATRMREVARIIAAEHSNSTPAVARRASVVLALLAARRPLAERPPLTASLERSAERLAAAPSLAVAAGLTALEVEDLTAMDGLIRAQRATEEASPGAPPADRVRAERRWAAGRRALELLDAEQDIDEVIAGILSRVDGALAAIEDAIEDADLHPGPRAAAALLALSASDVGAVSGIADLVAGDHGGGAVALRWRGLGPAELVLIDDDVDDDLRAFTEAVDRLLAAQQA